MNNRYLVIAECIRDCFGLCCKKGERKVLGSFESEYFAKISAKAIEAEIDKYYMVYVLDEDTYYFD